MALKLIRRGPETVRLVVETGSGWRRAYREGIPDAVRDYSPAMMVVSANGCDGLRIIDYDAEGRPTFITDGGTAHTLTAIKTGWRGVVQVLNPTDKTEVIMHVVPIPPPCSIAGLLRRWVGGCRGADQNRRTRQRRGGTLGAGKHAGVGGVAKTRSALARHRNIQHGNDRRAPTARALQGGANRWAGSLLAGRRRREHLRNPVLRRGRDATRILRPEPGNPLIHHPARLTPAGGEHRGA